jgi:hypothetical protein
MILRMAAARIIPSLGGILYAVQNGCCQDNSYVTLDYDLKNDCCQDQSGSKWNLIFRIVAARTVPMLVGK